MGVCGEALWVGSGRGQELEPALTASGLVSVGGVCARGVCVGVVVGV